MNRVWANSLEDGIKTWDEVPAKRRDAVREILREDVYLGRLSVERYQEITGETYEA